MALEQLRGVILVQSPWALHIRHVSRDIPGGDEVPVCGGGGKTGLWVLPLALPEVPS